MEENTQYTVASFVADLKNIVKNEDEIGTNGTTHLTPILDSLAQETCIEVQFVPIDMLLMLLKDKSQQIVATAAKAIAEFGKTEKGRDIYTDANIVDILINLLQEEDVNVLTQTSRALGNICYENANGKALVSERNGLQTIITILEKTINSKDIDSMSTLRKVTTGLLLNFLVDQPSINQQELKDMVVPIVYNVLEIDALSGEETVSHVILILGILSDAGIIVLNEKLAKIIVNILQSDASLEIFEMCLELLYDQAENDKVKVLLVQVGIPELLLDLIETAKVNRIKEAKSLLKVAYKLIVLILTGDESMNLLYDGSHGTVYRRLVKWLDHEDEDFQLTAVTAMGNFARTDTHCSLMVAQGVHRQLLKLLQKEDGLNNEIKFQHALLSALRNLVIPTDNKNIMLKDGLIEALYPTLNIPTFPVVFKLLGTLRIVIDGQKEAATSLGSREDFIKKVIEWCNADDHLGVQSEANRLLAWLVNNSKAKTVALLIIKCGGVQHLAKMMLTQHAVMQNEAILSLTILTAICLTEMGTCLMEIEIGRTISNFLEKNACNLELPILFNLLTLINNMIKSDVLKQHLRNLSLMTALEKASVAKSRKNSDLNERLKAVYLAIES